MISLNNDMASYSSYATALVGHSRRWKGIGISFCRNPWPWSQWTVDVVEESSMLHDDDTSIRKYLMALFRYYQSLGSRGPGQFSGKFPVRCRSSLNFFCSGFCSNINSSDQNMTDHALKESMYSRVEFIGLHVSWIDQQIAIIASLDLVSN